MATDSACEENISTSSNNCDLELGQCNGFNQHNGDNQNCNGFQEHNGDHEQFNEVQQRNEHVSPTHSNQGSSGRTNLQKLCREKRAKKILFYRNGDRFFKGLLYALSAERIRSFDALLEDLTRVLVDQVNLPKGVRHIFSVDGKEKILFLDNLLEGEKYVCSSTDHFVKLDYVKNKCPHWSMTLKPEESPPNRCEGSVRESRDFIKPKLVTIMRNGNKPRKVARILLNKKTAHSFDQVLNEITNVIKLDSGAVRKVFTLGGKQVMCLADFFAEDDIFIAYGSEKFSHDDFDLDSEEYKYLGSSSRFAIMCEKYRHNYLHSPIARRRISSPAYNIRDTSGLLSVSTSNSSRSSLCASPMFANRSHRRSPSFRTVLQNGCHKSIPCLPKEILQCYNVGKVIGDGNFAVVYECVEKMTGNEFALKVIDKNKCKGKEHMIVSEVSILRRVKHPNIVQLMDEFDLDNELYLVMELVKGGDLFDSITSANKYTERDASGMVHNLASALCYLHSLNIVHRDIKPENLLVVEYGDGSKLLKLGDFGLAVEVKEPLYTICGTPTYVAPEILAESGYGLKVDIWAAGVITYILLCGFPPFVSQNNDQEELFDNILAGKYEFASPYWDDISEPAKELICYMLQVDSEARYSAAQVLEHSWVSDESILSQDRQSIVSKELSMHFEHKAKPSLKSAGIALIALTALDKKGIFFRKRQSEAASIWTEQDEVF